MSPTTPAFVRDFFVRHARALLDRDAAGIAELHAVPGLILVPGRVVAVNDRDQVEDFFHASWCNRGEVGELGNHITVIAEAPGSLWVDVTWSYPGDFRERFRYQLTEQDGEWYIAVVTPLDP